MLRGKILTAIPLLVLFFSLKSGQSDAVSYDNAERSLLVYRSGMQSVMDHIRKNRIIFPETETADKEILSENVRSELKSVWMSFVEYFIAAEAVEKKFCGLSYVDRESDIRCFNITKAAFLMKFRFAMEFISEMEKNKSFRTVLNDSIPEEGFPSGMYNDIKFRYLNLMAATEYAAYRTLSVNYPDPENEDLKKGINTDSDYLWDAGKGRGEILTIENSAGVIRRTIKKVLFPFQKNISSIAGDVKVYRFGSTLISPEQIEEMKTKLLPGDILLERREWYLTNIGIPGFWTHAALYVGTPEERKKYFSSGIEKLLSDNSASDFEDLLNKKYGDAYGQSVNSSEPGHVPRIIEAISEGVVFTTIEHSASCDSIAALRTNLDKATIAKTILRAFHYSGRPYDFDFDFITDSKLVCTELVYKSFESENGNNPINFKMSSVAGRRMLTANGIAETCSKSDKENNSLSLVFFYDGMEFRKKSVKSDYAEFKKSISRAKWDIFK